MKAECYLEPLVAEDLSCRQSLLRVSYQQVGDQIFGVDRNRIEGGTGELEVSRQNLVPQILLFVQLLGEGRPAGEELVQDHSQGPAVNLSMEGNNGNQNYIKQDKKIWRRF